MKNYTLQSTTKASHTMGRMAAMLVILLFGILQAYTVQAQSTNIVFSSSSGSATSIQLNCNGSNQTYVDDGWIRSNGNHSSTNHNYYTGYMSTGVYLRSFFVFTNTVGTITTASITMNTFSVSGSGFSVHYYAMPGYTAAELDADRPVNDATGIAIFNAMGTGTYLGSSISNFSAQQVITTSLNVAALNAMGSSIRIVAKVDDFSGGYIAPVLTTAAASSVTTSSATFNGSITPNSNSGNYYYQYGTSGSYGSTTTSRAYTSSSSNLAEASVALSAGTTYYYRLYATVSGQSDVTGSQVSFSTPPAAPAITAGSTTTICNGSGTTLTATGGDGTVYWYTGNSCSGTAIGTGTSITVYPTGTTIYTARNYKNSLYSSCSSEATVTVNEPATGPLTAVCSSTTASTAALSWGTSTGTGTVSYKWVVGTSSSVVYGTVGAAGVAAQGITTAPTVTATATGLTASTGYYLRVLAYTSSPCTESGYRTSGMFTTVPLAPVASAASAIRANSFSANWAAATGATKYFLDVSTSATFTGFVSGYENKDVGNVVTYSITGLNNTTTYYYRVRAYNDGGTGVSSSPAITALTLPVNNFLTEKVGGGDIPEQLSGTAFSVKITARDAFNTTVSDYTGTATITSNSTLTAGGTTLAFTAGVLTSHSVTLSLAGAGKHLTAAIGSPAVSSNSNDFTVTPGAINYFALAVNGTVTAGTAFTVTATVYDEFGNVKTNYDGQKSVNWTTTATSSSNGTARIIPANGDQTFVAGVAIISGFTFFNSDQSQLAPYLKPTITITDAPTSSPGTTSAITVLNAALSNFKVEAGTVQSAGTPFSTTVTARDIYWNTCVDYAGNVRFKSSDDAVVAFPAGLQTFAPAATNHGVRTFTNAISISVMGAYWLRAADASFAFKSGEQQNIVVGPGVFSKLVTNSLLTISAPTPLAFVDPLSRVAGEYVLVTVTPRDALNNLLYACRNISVFLNGVPTHLTGVTGDPLSAITVTNVGDGTYTALVRVTTTGTNLITASFNDYDPDILFNQVRTVNVSPAPVNLAHTLITADPSTMTTDEHSNITVQLKDQFDNNRTTSDGTVVLATSRGVLTGGVTDNANGTYSAILYGNNGAVGNAHITGSFTGNSQNLGINGPITDTEDVTINEGLPALATIEITANPTVITTNGNSTVSVQLKDQFGNLVTTNRGTIALLTDKGALSDVVYTSGGIYQSTLTGFKPGFGPATITGKYNGGDIADNATVTFNQGLPDLAHITISASPETMTSDGSSLITVQLQDVYGNIITTSRGTVTLVSDKGALTAVTDHADGTYSATLTGDDRGFGNATITGTLTGTVTGTITDNAVVNITQGKPDLTDITITPASGTMTTDQTRLITVQLKDQFGNNLTTSRGTVTLFTSLTGTALNTVTDNANGTYSATLSTTVTGTATITGHLVDTPDGIDGNISDNAVVEIAEGKPALAQIQITVSDDEITTDETSIVTIQLKDQWGNNLSTQRGTVALTAVSKGAITAATYITAGYYTATLSGDDRGVGLTDITGVLTDEDDAVTGTITDKAQVTFTEGLPALATTLILANPTTMTTDETSTITVQLKDQFGNLIVNDRSTVALSTTLGVLTGGVSYTGAGIYTATLHGNNTGVGTATITGTLAGVVTGNIADNTTTVTITEGLPALATTLITANPTTMTTDGTSTITVQLKDQFGNLIVNNRSTVALSTTLGVLTGGVSYTGAGIYTATLYGNNTGVGTATLTGTLAGVVAGNIADNTTTVEITEGLPSLVTTTITPASGTMTTDETRVITVQLKDQFGNLIINNRGTIALSATIGSLTTPVSYAGSGTYTATLSGDTRGTNGTGTSTITGTYNTAALSLSASVIITEGLPDLVTSTFGASPTTITTDQASVITVQLKDHLGNNIINNRGDVTLVTDLGALTSAAYTSLGRYTATLTANAPGTGTATISGSFAGTGTASSVVGDFTNEAEVTITEGIPALAQIQITVSDDNITTDETSLITVQLRDQWGNNLTTQRGTVALASSAHGVIGTVTYAGSGTYTATLSGDSRDIGLTYITGVLTDVADGVTGTIADNATVTFTEGLPALATTLILADPTTMTIDQTSTITVQLKDQFGNLITHDRSTVALSTTLGVLTGGVSYTGAGIYTATLHGNNTGVGTATITGTLAGVVAGNIADNTTTVDITEGLPALATTLITANPITMTTDGTSTISVQLKDQFGNLITHDRSTVALSTTLGVLTGGVSYTGAGIYTATLYGNNTGVGTATLTGTLAGDVAGNIADNTTTVTITEGLPSLATTTITPASGTMTTDETRVITVQLKDQFGNLIINNRGTVALSATIGSLTSVSYAGSGTYTATLSGDNGGTNGTGTSTITGTYNTAALSLSASVIITEGLPDLVTSTFGASPTSITTDQTSLITVQLKDHLGNDITHSRGTVALLTSKGVLTGVTNNNNGTYTATLSANNTNTGIATISGGLTGTVTGAFTDDVQVTITEGLPVLAQIQITANPTSITADQTSTITVQLKDQHGNNLTTSRGSIALASANLTGTNISTVTDNGNGTYTATFSMIAYGTGTATITGIFTGTGNAAAVHGDITDNAMIAVSHGVATKLAILTQPSATATAGVVFAQQPVVRIEDQFGNLVTSDDATVVTAARATGTATLQGTLTATATDGIATFTGLFYNKAETITLGFSSSPALTTVTSTNIVVGHAPIDHFTLSAPANFTAGSARVAYTVTRWDAFNNLVTTGAQSAYLYSSSTGANKKFYSASTGASVITSLSIANGSSTASFWYYDEKTGDHTITASDNAAAPDGDVNINDGTDQITVTPALLKNFIVYGIENPHDFGTVQSVTVEPRDTYNNRKTNYVGTITFSNTDENAVNPGDYHFLLADQGIHTFTDAVLFSQPGNWWVTAIDLAEPTKYGAEANIIVQRAVSIVANDRTKTYGDILSMGTTQFTVNQIVPGSSVYGPVDGEITGVTLVSSGSAALADAGDYNITPSLATGPYTPLYYRIVYSEAGQLTVNPATLAVTANTGQTKVYGEADPTPFTYAASGFKNEQTVSIMTGSLSRVAGEYVNTYAIGQNTLSAGSNYTISYTGANFSITKKPITVIASAGQTKVYGQVDPTFAYTSNVATAFSDVFVGALARTSGEDVASNYAMNIGSLTIENGSSVNVASNYTISFTTADFAITQLALTVTADAKSKTYGQVDPALTFVSVPSVGTVLANGHLIAFTGALSRATGEDVGAYAIGQNSVANSNYAITYTGANLTIGQLAVAVNADAKSKTYGQVDPALTFVSVPAVGTVLANGHAIAFTGALLRATGEDVGAYAIGKNTVANSNYAITYTGANLTIGQLAVAVNADAKSKTYGQVDPALTFVSVPAVGNELANGHLIAFTGALSRATGEDVGAYAIGQNSVANSNYAITYTGANLTIGQLAVAVNAVAKSKTYGDVDPALTFVSVPSVGTELANGDLIAFTGALLRATGEDVGAYAIGQNTVANSNYSITYTGANLTIGQLAVAVNADAKSKTYGQVDPALTFVSVPAVGFTLNNGLSIGFTGALSRATGETVGAYAIGQNSVANSNYAITYTGANLTIGQLAVTVNADAKSKTYGNADPALTFVSSPAVGTVLANNDVIGFTGALSRAAGESVLGGPYAIGQNTVANSNYTISYTAANLTINTRPITLTADNRTKTYGDLLVLGNTQFGITGDGMAYSETIGTVTLTSLGTPVQANVGTYAISTASGAGANGYLVSNYNVTYSSAGTLTIGVRTLNLSYFGADNKEYDGNTTATGIGFMDDRVPGDFLSFQRTAAFDTKDVGVDKPVYYTNIAITGGSDRYNYVLASTTGTANADIFAKALTVTASNDSRLYSGSPYTGGNGVTYSGFITGENASVLSGTLTYSGTSQGATQVGDYTITPGGYTPGNYTYTYVDGTLSIFGSLSVSGTFKYYNTARTPLSGVNIELWSTGVGGVKIYPATGTVVTNAAGEYSFPDVAAGTYVVKATATASIDGAINSTDAAQVNYWATHYSAIEKVKFYAGDVVVNNRLTGADASTIVSYYLGTTTSWGARGNWTFWKNNDNVPSNNPGGSGTVVLPQIVVSNSSLTSSFYGLATGDFNLSFLPGGGKSSYQSVSLNHDQIIQVDKGNIFELPVIAGTAMEVGAVSLILNFPADKLELLGVSMGEKADTPVNYAVKGNEVRISWFSGNAVSLNVDDRLLTLKVRAIESIAQDETLRFELDGDPLNELANGSYTAIDGAVLKMAEIGSSGQDGKFRLANYPNPFRETTTFTYSVPSDGKVSLEIYNMLGSKVKVLLNEAKTAGDYSFEALTDDLNPGIYTATLRVSTRQGVLSRTIKIICNQ